MAQVIFANQRSVAVQYDGFVAIWALTRALLAAGYKYKGSGDATASGTKSTDGNWLGDKWGQGGGVNLLATVQTNTSSDVMTANTDGTVTHAITGATFSATLSVGRFLTISGAVNASNNGTFRIVAYTSATTVKVFNPASTTETTSITWAERHGGANGSITAVSTGGATRGRAIFTVSSGTPFVAPTAFPVNRGSVGDRLTIIGATTGANNTTSMITRVISSTSVEIDNASATTDAGNPTLSWAQCSPTQQTIPASLAYTAGNGAWINLQGPSTLKIPTGANAASAAFQRGELVTQTTSGATGTILGVITDTGTSLGMLVVEPRLNGTGGGVRGWTTGGTDTVTGATSGATITTANITPVEFVREFVIWKNYTGSNSFYMHMWAQTVDQAAESASRFSVLAAGGSVSNVICPGGVTGTFPAAGSFVLCGTGGSNASGTGSGFFYGMNLGSAGGSGNAHVLCATCIENATESADGSWTLLQGAEFSFVDSYAVLAFQHVDGSEEGDLDPYVYFIANGVANDGGNRVVNTASYSWTSPFMQMYGLSNQSIPWARGWRRRGWASADAYQDYRLGTLLYSGNTVLPYVTTQACRVMNHPNPNLPIREAIHVLSIQSAQKQRKGYLRWWFSTEGGSCNRLLFNGAYVQIHSTLTNGNGGPVVCGPWDGVTIPQCGAI
jgi:hypothetical protein